MDVDRERNRNMDRAEAEAHAGPARSTPDAMPIGEAIEDFHRRGDLSLGIPGTPVRHRSPRAGHQPVGG